jgi:hypothetical protein
MAATSLPGAVHRALVHAGAGTAIALAVSAPALAQSGSTTSIVPRSGFFAGLGGSYNSIKFGTQDLYAIGTSEITQGSTLVATGYAAGPGYARMPSESSFAPSAQLGWFQHFADSDWLWGLKFAYSYLDTTSTVQPLDLPQAGTFTQVSNGVTTPFVGNAVMRSFRTTIEHQVLLVPIIGRSFERSFVYAGAGASWSRTKTNIDGLVGFADILGQHVDVSGAPQDFAASGSVWGVAGVVGATWFLDRSWFVDASYFYSRTHTKTYSYSGSFENTSNPFGTTTGTLVGDSSGRVTTQGLMVTINKTF